MLKDIMNTNVLVVLLILIIAAVFGVIFFFVSSNKTGNTPSPSPSEANFTVVTDSQWNKLGVYPQWDDSDVDGHLRDMMTTNAGFGDRGQWSSRHFGFLFYPGVTYTKTIQVGYLTTANGMGMTPLDVAVPLFCLGDKTLKRGALNVFWRSAENLQLLAPTTCPPTFDGSQEQGTCTVVEGGIKPGPDPVTPSGCTWQALVNPTWAASQASSLRRVNAAHLMLDYQPGDTPPPGSQFCSAFASGGFMADCNIATLDQESLSGQQQYMFMTSAFGTIPVPNVWNYVFVGCTGGLQQDVCGNKPPVQGVILDVAATRAKPTLAWSPQQDKQKQAYSVYFDAAAQFNTLGVRPLGQPHSFQLATNESELKALLAAKSPVIVIGSPNDILISQDIVLQTDGTTIVGIGMPTLLLADTATVRVQNNNCCLCGLVFDCRGHKEDMLCWQSTETDPFQSGLLADCYFRVGGMVDPKTVSCNAMCHVISGRIIIENSWMWRADHGPDQWPNTGRYDLDSKTYYNDSKIGLHVEKNAVVVAYGLACEHCTDVCCKWEGDNGELYFYQCELPYCVSDDWNSPGIEVLGDNFTGVGLGVYCYFPDKSFCQTAHPLVDTGIVVPSDAKIRNAITVWLDGVKDSGIKSVLKCGAVISGSSVTGPNQQSIVCHC